MLIGGQVACICRAAYKVYALLFQIPKNAPIFITQDRKDDIGRALQLSQQGLHSCDLVSISGLPYAVSTYQLALTSCSEHLRLLQSLYPGDLVSVEHLAYLKASWREML